MSEIIEIDADTRLRVEYDSSAENPLTWGDHVKPGDKVMQRWESGEVYGVILERRVEWKPVDEAQASRGIKTTWEEDESLWGCYLDEKYTARVVANEHWGVPL